MQSLDIAEHVFRFFSTFSFLSGIDTAHGISCRFFVVFDLARRIPRQSSEEQLLSFCFSCFVILHPVAQKRDIFASGTQRLCSKHMNNFSRCFPSRQLSFPLSKEKYTVDILGCVLSRFEVLRTRFCRCALVACRSKYM